MKNLLMTLLVALLVAPMVSGAGVETTKLRPSSIYLWEKSKSPLKPMIECLPVRRDLEYASLFKVDTDLLRQVPDCQIESVDFSFQLWHIEGHGGGVIEMRPLKNAITNLSAKAKYSIHELTDLQAKPFMRFPLPEKLESNKRYTFPIPKDEATLAVLKKGVILTLHGRTVQVNIAGTDWNHAKHTRTHNPFLTVRYTTPVERLSLTHRIKPQKGKYVTAKDGDF